MAPSFSRQKQVKRKKPWTFVKNKISDTLKLDYETLKGESYRAFIIEGNTKFFCNLYNPAKKRKVRGRAATNDQDYNDFVNNYKDSVDGLPPKIEEAVASTAELQVSWAILKDFYDTYQGCFMNFVEFTDYYYIWMEFRGQKLFIPRLMKNGSATEFETSYKSKCNVMEAVRTRITTNKTGRHLHMRFITIVTSDQDNFDNTDWQETPYGDLTYVMMDSTANITTVNAEAKETWIMIEPEFDFEVSGGAVSIPNTLAGGNDDAWEVHVVGVPDLPAVFGGNIHFVANPRLKWNKGESIMIDASLNPAEMTYNETYHTSKLLFCFKHPVGAQTEFQIRLKLFK